MAITKSITYGDGVTVSYWRLLYQKTDYTRREAVFTFGGWVNSDAYAANKLPARYEEEILTGQDFTDVFDEGNENIAAMSLAIANKVVAKTKFSGGTIS